MGFRFRKIISVLPGVKVNLSKTGVSTSLGGKGATVNVGSTGKKTLTLGVPGSGMSYQIPLTWTTLAVVLIGAVLLAGIAYLLAPTYIQALLHWWQPKIF